MRLLIMGAPGAGKGTQALRISETFGIPHISTGDLFRDHVKRGSELGKLVQGMMSRGEFVPDEVTTQMVRHRFEEEDAKRGFLLDGYPRTTGQVGDLDAILAEQGAGLDGVLELTVDTEVVVQRLLARAAEQGRLDDTEEVIRHRQDLYHEQTEAVTALYEARGQLVRVDGLGEVDEVAARVMAALGR